jgi:hypothetical protein
MSRPEQLFVIEAGLIFDDPVGPLMREAAGAAVESLQNLLGHPPNLRWISLRRAVASEIGVLAPSRAVAVDQFRELLRGIIEGSTDASLRSIPIFTVKAWTP